MSVPSLPVSSLEAYFAQSQAESETEDDIPEVEEFISADKLVNVFVTSALTAEKLRVLADTEDLTSVTRLEIKVDANDNSLSALGTLLPNIRELKLSNSALKTIRDLGTSLANLHVLWIARTGLKDLEGIGALTSLRELYVAFNDVSDLSPLASHPYLEVLDLDTNCVEDVAQVSFLHDCPNLRSLILESNPVQDSDHYRQAVFKLLPNLETLDEEDKSTADAIPPPDEVFEEQEKKEHEGTPDTAKSVEDEELEKLKAEKDIVGVGIKSARIGIDDDFTPDDECLFSGSGFESLRPGSARPMTARYHTSGPFDGRPMTASISLRPGTASSRRPMSARPATVRLGMQRPQSAMGSRSALQKMDKEDSASDLTFGAETAFVGSASRALRNRKQQAAENDIDAPKITHSTISGDLDDKEILEQLKAWKMETASMVMVEDDPIVSQTIDDDWDSGMSLSGSERTPIGTPAKDEILFVDTESGHQSKHERGPPSSREKTFSRTSSAASFATDSDDPFPAPPSLPSGSRSGRRPSGISTASSHSQDGMDVFPQPPRTPTGESSLPVGRLRPRQMVASIKTMRQNSMDLSDSEGD